MSRHQSISFWSSLLAFLLLGFSSPGQIVNKGQIVTLTQTALVTTSSLYNDSLGFIQNNGTIRISGNWINDGSYQPGEGTIILTGTDTQTIRQKGKDDVDKRFSKLFIENNIQLLLETDIWITNTLKLNQAIVRIPSSSLSEANKLILHQTAVIQGDAQDSYIDGALYWAGTGKRKYPIGRNGVYANLELSEEPDKDPTEPQPIVGVRLVDPPPNPLKPDTSLNRLSTIRYWERVVVRGSSEKAYATLSVQPDEGITSLDSVVVAGTNNMGTSFSSLGRGIVTGTPDKGTVTSKQYANTRFLALGEPIRGELLYIPNAFAPASLHPEENVFKIYGTTLSDEGIQLMIYNRWGNLIFRSRSLEEITRKGWNGQNTHTHQDETGGVYTYVLQGKFTTGKPFRRAGTVTLLR